MSDRATLDPSLGVEADLSRTTKTSAGSANRESTRTSLPNRGGARIKYVKKASTGSNAAESCKACAKARKPGVWQSVTLGSNTWHYHVSLGKKTKVNWTWLYYFILPPASLVSTNEVRRTFTAKDGAHSTSHVIRIHKSLKTHSTERYRVLKDNSDTIRILASRRLQRRTGSSWP